MRVKFLVTKRYPHPDGQKRYPGDEVDDMPDDLAELWVERGVVKKVGRSKAEQPEQPEPPLLPGETPKDDPAGQPEDAPTELAEQPNSDLRTHTLDDASAAFGEVLSNAEPQPKKGRK